MCVGRSEDNFQESVLPFYFYVSYGTKLGLPGLPRKDPYPLSHLVSPSLFLWCSVLKQEPHTCQANIFIPSQYFQQQNQKLFFITQHIEVQTIFVDESFNLTILLNSLGLGRLVLKKLHILYTQSFHLGGVFFCLITLATSSDTMQSRDIFCSSRIGIYCQISRMLGAEFFVKCFLQVKEVFFYSQFIDLILNHE